MGATTYTYDALGRPHTVTDGRGVRVTYRYDARDRITRVKAKGTPPVFYSYDGDGNVTSRKDSTGWTRYEFDALNRETIRTLKDGSQTVLAYTADSNIDSYTDPGGVTDYTWDMADRLSSLTDPAGKKTTYKYNKNGARTETAYPGGTVQTNELDKSGRPKNIKATSGSNTLLDLSYSYERLSRGKAVDGGKVRALTDNSKDRRTTYTYDSLGRLTGAKETQDSAVKAQWHYCFDPAGNLTSQGGDADCPGERDYSYNDASQLSAGNGDSSGWSYDGAGNETSGASTQEGARTEAKWTGFSQLKSLTVGDRSYRAAYAGTGNAERTRLGETTFHNGPIGLAASTTHGEDTGFVREVGGQLHSMTRDGKSYYYLTDAIGSVMGLVDEAGKRVNSYAYTPTGVQRGSSTEKVSQPHRFAGTYLDPTGLYHMKARYYDPHIGRFTQTDPAGMDANPYLYASADPINRVDPEGTWDWDKFLGTWGGIIGIGAGLGAVGGCLVGGFATGGIGCIPGAGVGAVAGTIVGTVVGLPIAIWRAW